MPSARNARIEALRIVAMLGIVGHHYVVHGGVQDHTQSGSSAVFLAALGSYGKWGVDLFVLVSAYFFDRRPARGKSLSSVYSQVLPASWLILIAAAAAGMTVSGADIREALFPVLFDEYWFVTTFVILVLIAPYLSLLLDHLTVRQQQRLLLAGFILWSVLTLLDRVNNDLSDLAWFAYLYLLGAYIRRHPIQGDARAWAITASAALVLLAAVPTLLVGVGVARGATPGDLGWLMDTYASDESPFSLAAAVAVLVWAIKARPWNSRVVNYWAAAAFGVYLIHDNPLVRRVLWSDIVDTTSAAGQWWLPLHAVIATVAVYVACSVIIFALQPTVFRAMHVVTEAVRTRVEARLTRGADTSDPQRSTS
ncbi:acyltransferase [Demequina sp. NBRC 110055]|uniref:acyltransferase family protein n=1 Tax=Demequina sp. NBRC 110055 TaxID=1570344 RepID=UPI000A0414F3|nr:acyltransferase [Demequina sp. NBRC 110055]